VDWCCKLGGKVNKSIAILIILFMLIKGLSSRLIAIITCQIHGQGVLKDIKWLGKGLSA
jgi:hypothetical protein